MMSKKISYQAPSNIALVKYWGKYGDQLPSNASISFTLDVCRSIFEVELSEKKSKTPQIDLEFEGKKNEKFIPKIQKLFDKIALDYSVVRDYDWTIRSSNTFPHSSGIASSASSMAALAMCIDELQYGSADIQRASQIARLGSGSASRSVIPRLAWWGHHPAQPLTSQEYAVEVWEDVDEIFWNYKDTILIASSDEKSVSSSLGHELMNNHIYASSRYSQAMNAIVELYGAMREGDLMKFGEIVESEALTLHALMMMSTPSYILMKPSTLTMIERIKRFREETKLPVYFTLDAGPNIHLLYPATIEDKIVPFVAEMLKPLCENGFYIKDQTGNGPSKIS